MANKAGCGVIVHLPTSKAQSLPPSQRLLHPLLPFLAHTSRPESSTTIITLMNTISNGTKQEDITTHTHISIDVLSQISEGSDENKNMSQKVYG